MNKTQLNEKQQNKFVKILRVVNFVKDNSLLNFIGFVFCETFKHSIHLLWLVFIVSFGFLGIFATFLNNDYDGFVCGLTNSGELCFVSVAILAPCLFDLLAGIYFDRINGCDFHFLGVKVTLSLIGIVLCVYIPLFASGIYKSNLSLQVIISLLLIVYSYVCYLSKFLCYPENEDIDDPIRNAQKIENEKLNENIEQLTVTDVGGEEIKL